MRIKTGLQIITILCIGVALAVGLTLFLTIRQVTRVHETSSTSELLLKGMAELEILTHDYLLYHEDRPKEQWLSKDESLAKFLKTAEFMSPEEKDILENVRHNYGRLKPVFIQLVTTHGKIQTLDQRAADVYRELEERLTSRLLLRLQTCISEAFRLGEASHAAMVSAQQDSSLIIIVFVGIVAAVILAILFLMDRSLIKPIAQLRRGAGIIGAGNLDHKVGTAAKDEIGDLSRAFDQMTGELRTTTVSRDRLTEEIAQRRRAEERTNHLNLVLRAIRRVNQVISMEKDRDRLLQGVCDTLIGTRGYYNAWIALFDESRRLVTTAEAGLGKDFLPMKELLKGGELMECGQMALDQPGVVTIEDPSATCTHCPLSGKYHGRAGMKVRLKDGGKIYGVLTVSISREFAFDIEEQELLEEVAGDIGLALYSLDLEEERKRAGEKYRTLFEDSRDAIYIATRNGLLTDANQSFFGLFGYTREEIASINTRQLYVNPDDRQRFREEIEQKGYVKDFEVKLKKKDGTGMDCFLTATVQRADDGSIFGYQGIIRDVTEHRNMEEQLRQGQKMEAIGVLAGGVAHDFNNILTTIIGNADLALMNVGKDDPLRKRIDEIRIAGERATSLARQLLAFSRKQIIRPEILDLNKLLTDIEKMLKRLIGEDVELLTIPGPELWQVEADPGQMEQVVMNLVVNARDAMPRGGKLTVETANVDLDRNYFHKHGIGEEQPGPYVMLAVSDTGIGIDKETQKQIFDPFFTTKETGKGTGLGLSTVYGIVRQNNGFIWVYSEPGQGTTFKVYLSRAKGDVASEKKEQHPVTGLGGSETILIVEDDGALRKLAQTVLKQWGYKVLEAENGEDALRVSKAHDGSIDLLITDVVMPKMDGKEVADRLQPLYPLMKVIYMSGYTDNIIVHHGILAPGLNFFEKPFTPEGLARKVREILNAE